MKQCLQARLHSVPPTWNQSVSRLFNRTLGTVPVEVGVSTVEGRGDRFMNRDEGSRYLRIAVEIFATGVRFHSAGGWPATGGPGSRLRYDRPTLTRFLILVVPLLLVLFALHAFVIAGMGWGPDTGPLARYGLSPDPHPPMELLLGGWLLESLGLTALFLLVQGRSGSAVLDGLATGWIAWIFRGPVLVLTLERWSRLPREPWWPLAQRWLVLYTICGLALAFVARRTDLRRSSN